MAPSPASVSADRLEAARLAVGDCGLPFSTAPMAPDLAWALGQLDGDHQAQDLRAKLSVAPSAP
jgi:hypothetical protein